MNPTIIGIAAGILTAVSLLPQIFQTIKKKKAKDVSLFMLAILFIGNGLWIYYGFLIDAAPIYTTNMISLLTDIIMIYLKFRYRSK